MMANGTSPNPDENNRSHASSRRHEDEACCVAGRAGRMGGCDVPRWFRPVVGFGLAVLRPFLSQSLLDKIEHFAWFIFIGTANTCLSYLIFVLLLNLFSLERSLALLGAYLLGMLISYQSFSRFVFGREGKRGAFIRFVFAYVLLYVANKLILDGFIWVSGFSEELAQFLLLPVVAALSYIFNKVLVFRS